jgi:Putative zinc-finger
VSRTHQTGGGCGAYAHGVVDLYFYGELAPEERRRFEAHLSTCVHCREGLEELTLIREALSERPFVEAPPSGDWSGFMSRLDSALAHEAMPDAAVVVPFERLTLRPRRSYLPLFAMAALLALVTLSVLVVLRSRGPEHPEQTVATAPQTAVSPGDTAAGDTGTLSAVSQQHLERSKLVLLGLASKDAERTAGHDWTYERELAARLLTDTRLYRMAAEQRGLDALAGVMRDLELILLQTSMTEQADPAALAQIQRAIRKRDLLQKMDVVRTTGI